MKSLTRTLTFTIAALSMSAAHAIDKCSPKLLMDNGFGSEATDGWTDYSGFDPEINIVGSKNDALGRSLPTSWRYDPASGLVTEFGMPALDFRGSCSAGRGFLDGSDVAVGHLIAANGSTHAVVWRRGITANDDWEAPIALAPGSEASICGHEIAHGIQADAAGSIRQEGRWQPVVFLKVNVDIAHTLLPIPPTAQGQALTIDGDPGSRTIGGWVQMPGGLRKPVIWEESGTGWTLKPVQVASNAWGQIDDVLSLNGGSAMVGTLVRNGRSAGIWVPQGSPLRVLPPLPGLNNSTAYNLGDTGTHEVGHIIFGGSFNTVNNPTATCWLDQAPIAARQLLVEPNAFGQVLGFQWGVGRGALGNVMQSSGSLVQACLFLATNEQLPDRVQVPVGRALGEGSGDIVAMWHDDGEMFGVRTEKVNNQRMACIDLDFTPLSFSAGQDARMDAQIMIPNQVTGGTISVYAFNPSTQEFDPLYTNNPGGGLLGISVAVPSQYENAQSGQVRLRLEFKHGGNQPKTIGIETIEIAHEG